MECSMMKIIVGSTNPAKISAVEQLAVKYNGIIVAVEADSGISAQPFSDEETIEGAINRASSALKIGEGAIGIGLEGGVEETAYGLVLCNWGALCETGKPPIIAGGARILLPEEIAEDLRQGKELGPVMEAHTNKQNVRKKEGAVGIFSNGFVSRGEMFGHVAKLLFGQYEYRKLKSDGR